MPTQDDPYIASLKAEIEELRARINHSGAVKRKINREVLEELHEMSGNPDEHYIPPVTLAKRAVRAETKVKRLQAVIDKLPKDADGVPVVPFGGTIVWVHTRRSGLYQPGEGKKWWPMRVNAFDNGFLHGMVEGSHYAHVRPKDVHSTREAAEAVRDGET